MPAGNFKVIRGLSQGAPGFPGAPISLRLLSHSGLVMPYLSLSPGSSVGSGAIIASGSNVES